MNELKCINCNQFKLKPLFTTDKNGRTRKRCKDCSEIFKLNCKQKKCHHCNELKENNKFNYYYTKSGPKIKPFCKNCEIKLIEKSQQPFIPQKLRDGEVKLCHTCNENKFYNQFKYYKTSYSWSENCLDCREKFKQDKNWEERKCKMCGNIKQKNQFPFNKGWICKACASKNSCAYSKIKWQENKINYPEILMWKSVRNRAHTENIPFNLEPKDIVIPKYCPVLQIELKPQIKQMNGQSPSIDKVIPEKGYIKGNTNIISMRANRIKTDANLNELEKVTQYVRDNVPDTIEYYI